MTPEQFDRLPRYARQHIENCERRAEVAEGNLAAYIDNQTESRIYFTDRDNNKIYLNEDASERLTVKSRCGKVHLAIRNYHDDRIELSWSGGRDEYGMGDVCFIPTSYQQARLVHPSNAHAR